MLGGDKYDVERKVEQKKVVLHNSRCSVLKKDQASSKNLSPVPTQIY